MTWLGTGKGQLGHEVFPGETGMKSIVTVVNEVQRLLHVYCIASVLK